MKKYNFFGIETTVLSDVPEFLNFVDSNLYFFHYSDLKNPPLCSLKLSVDVFFNNKVSIHSFFIGAEKIGNDAFLKGNRYLCQLGPLLIEYKWSSPVLKVECYLIARESIQGKLWHFLSRKIFGREEDYFVIVRQTILFPIIWLLARFPKVFSMHAAAINYSGSGVILAGLASIGKSTMSLSFTLNALSTFLADNYLLYDKEKIYPFPEWIRLSSETISLLGNIEKLGYSKLKRYGRNYYQLDRSLISEPVIPKIIFFPRISKNNMIKQISVSTAIDRILLSNNHVREFPEHSLPGLVDFIVYNEDSLYENMLETLRNLLTKAVIFEVGINYNFTPRDNLEKLLKNVL